MPRQIKPLALVVDDNDELRNLLSMILELEGYPVVSAAHGGEALDLVRNIRPAVVLLDMNMPEVDGLSFLDRLPREVDPPLPVVVAMSADKTFRSIAKAKGAADFIQKPISADILIETLDAAMSRKPVDRQLRIVHLRNIRQKYSEDDKRRNAILDASQIQDPAFHRMVSHLLRWLSGYFAIPMSLVNLLYLDRLVLFETYGVPSKYPAGMKIPCEATYCVNLIRTNESLVLNDALVHPLYKDHPVTRMGVRFYASVPVRTPIGLSLGTLCLESIEPAEFHAEDVPPMAHFADELGRSIYESTLVRPAHWSFFPHPVFLEPRSFAAVLQGRVHRNEPRLAESLRLAALKYDSTDFPELLSKAFLSLASRKGLALTQPAPDRTLICLGSRPEIDALIQGVESVGARFSRNVYPIPTHPSDTELSDLIGRAS